MQRFNIAFWTPGTKPDQNEHLFGCASQGYTKDSQWIEPASGKLGLWEEEITGTLFSGDHERVLNGLKNCGFTPGVCIAFFRKTLTVERFIQRFSDLLPNVPLIGGGAAIGEGQSQGEILPAAEEVALLATAESGFELQSLNIFDQTGIELEIHKTSDREFDKVKLLPGGPWQPASEFLRKQKESRGINQDDFESLTFHDNDRRNIHCSVKKGQILSGANLPENNRLMLCVVDRKEATRRLSAFISKERSLVIGCAGIRSLIQEPMITGNQSLAGFLFGEIFTYNSRPMFGNLMLARLSRK